MGVEGRKNPSYGLVDEMGEQIEMGIERCTRCGLQVFPFSSKMAESDRQVYCVKCAEHVDSAYMAKNICSVCTRLLSKSEARFINASKLYSEGRLSIAERMVCAGCYKKLSISVRNRMEFSGKARQIRESIRRSIVKRMFAAKNYSVQEVKAV